MTKEGHAGDIGYRDVLTVVTLLEGGRGKRVYYNDGGLEVDAVQVPRTDPGASAAPGTGQRRTLDAPAVGIFRPDERLRPGVTLLPEHSLGAIEAPGSLTPLKAGAAATVQAVLVEAGAFVEYGEALVELASEPQAGG